MVQIS